ncbi:MAG: hypothetical protein ACI4XA_03760, partial [Oscillospiraceae bacterium]
MANKQISSLKRISSLLMSAVVAATMVQVQGVGSVVSAETAAETPASSNTAGVELISSTKNSYKNYIAKYDGVEMPSEEITVDVTNYTATDGALTEIVDFEGEKDCVSWLDSEGTITWKFDVKKAGLYNMEMFYYPLSGKNTTVEVELKIDGSCPFDETKLIELDRYWHNETDSIGYDALKKNQKRPPQVEYDCWVTYPIKDKDGLINTPYFFYLSEGTHELSLTGVKTNIYMKNIRFFNSEALPTYDSIRPTQEQLENTPALPGNQAILIEAETPKYTTSSTLYPTYDRTDCTVSPHHPVNKRYNTIGESTWDQATQTIVWKVEVPAAGYY